MLRGSVRGEAAITPSLGGQMLEEFRRLSKRAGPEVAEDPVALTRREQEVLALVAEGATDKEIADKLDCAVKTVQRKMNIVRRVWKGDDSE